MLPAARAYPMLSPTLAQRHARQLLDARSAGKLLPPFSAAESLSLADGYEIAKVVCDMRIAYGEQLVGRKVSFANKRFASQGVALGWTPLFDGTVRYVEDNHGAQSLNGAMQPRIQPEIVFKLASTPAANASMEELTDCIEWMAHGIEVLSCPYPDWQYEIADAVAAFGFHGLLLISEPKLLSVASRHHLAQILADSSVSLSCSEGAGFGLRAAGFGSDVHGSPVHALYELQRLLLSQGTSLQAGEIVSTGAWIEACPVTPGQTWTTAFSGIGLEGLTVSFV